ncbi:MAG TPA: BTAD domain-containing putative transcriptional regulator [Streptosporangiaceae bacterium]|nr:BTAD domain-containing putative transcriptional regulator [Streptosporangiaceae bacterium]
MTQGDNARAAALLKESRRAAGLSQRRLAELAQVSIGVVRDLEQRRTSRLRAESVRRLAGALILDQERALEFARAAGPGHKNLAAERSDQAVGQGLRLAVLGPVTAWRDGVRIGLGPARQRAVLGLLALTPNVPVPRKTIIDALWGDDVPATAVHLVQVYVNRLRHLLDPGQLLTSAGSGYELAAADGQLDLMVFEAHVSRATRAHAAGELGLACEAYARALDTWRAEPLADIEALHAHPVVVALRQRRSDLVIRYAEAATAAGRHEEVLPRLRELAAGEPLNERAHAALMLALAGSGQQAAALALFDDLRRRLDDQLGVRPGAELADAQQRVLRQDVPRGSGGSGRGLPGSGRQRLGTAGPAPLAPRQLPATVPNFAGRGAELATLTKALDHGDGERVRIMAITGIAGVGKTTLAVQWAHQVARSFPDGQLYADLRGFDPSGTPVAAADAVRGFLTALSVPAEVIPAGTDAQAGLYRSLLADRRMLVVLDNARDPAQVRPLLPGSAGCMVVVTSRSWMAGLVAAEGARQLSLDVLSDGEAAELLTGRLGRPRTLAEPEALAELIALCAGLPVALVIVAARATAQPHLSLCRLAAELGAAKSRLDALTTGDSATDVRSVFSWSYRSLSAPAARLFRLAGLHPGPSLSAEAAASLAGLPLPAVGRALRELAGACLIDECAPGRFTLHDLLREYVAERAKSAGTEVSRRAAIHRMLDHYLHTALAARTLLEPQQSVIAPARSVGGVTLGRFADRRGAANWFEAEHQALMAMITLAADLGFDLHACQLAVTLTGVLDQSACWEDLAASSAIAVATAHRAGHKEAEAYAERGLGGAFARLGRYDDAHVHLQRCLDQFTELKNIDGQARAHLNLACLLHYMDDSERALGHAHRARELFELLDEQQTGLAASLNTVGWFEARLGNPELGLAYCQQGLALAEENDNRVIAAATWDSLGYVRHLLGQHEAAVSCYQHAAGMYAALGAVWYRAEVLINLGDAHEAAGDRLAASELWREALEVYEQTHHPATERLRARLQGPAIIR